MTTRYSRREGAPLQEWAGRNEGCWATARPAAPPPAPSREALAKSTSSPPSSTPSCEHSPLRHPRPPLRPPSLTRRYSPFHPGHTTDQRCTSVLFFVIPLLTLFSFLSSFPLNSRPSPLSRVLLSHSLFLVSSVCPLRASRSFIAYLSSRAVDPA